jgi:hypothetical protein
MRRLIKSLLEKRVLFPVILAAGFTYGEEFSTCISEDTTMVGHLVGPVVEGNDREIRIGGEYSVLVNSYSVFFNTSRPVLGHVITGMYSLRREFLLAYGFEVIAIRYFSCKSSQANGVRKPLFSLASFMPAVEFGVDYSSEDKFGLHITGFYPLILIYPFLKYSVYQSGGYFTAGGMIKVPISHIYMP